jgi:hypothetical protein
MHWYSKKMFSTMQPSKHHWVCLLCGQAPETMQHFILACPFSRQVCHEVLSWLRFTCTPPDQEGSLMEWWSKAYQDTPKPLCKAWPLRYFSRPGWCGSKEVIASSKVPSHQSMAWSPGLMMKQCFGLEPVPRALGQSCHLDLGRALS